MQLECGQSGYGYIVYETHCVIPLFLLLFAQSCGFVYERHLTGNYYLIAVDTKEDMDVCYHPQSEDAPYARDYRSECLCRGV